MALLESVNKSHAISPPVDRAEGVGISRHKEVALCS